MPIRNFLQTIMIATIGIIVSAGCEKAKEPEDPAGLKPAEKTSELVPTNEKPERRKVEPIAP